MRAVGLVVALIATVVLLLDSSVALADGPFDQGRFRLSLGGATGGSFGNRYIVISAGFGYFVLDGWELGVEGETWLGGDPSVSKVSPLTRFVFHMIPVVHPYVGVFYKHWFIGSDWPDVDTLGGQIGILFLTGPNIVIGGGVAHEVIISDCEEDCSDTYPEFHVSLSF